MHYRDGKLNDGANGEMAVQQFSDSGELVLAAHYRHGKLKRTVSEEERDPHPEQSKTVENINEIQKNFGGKLKIRSLAGDEPYTGPERRVSSDGYTGPERRAASDRVDDL